MVSTNVALVSWLIERMSAASPFGTRSVTPATTRWSVSKPCTPSLLVPVTLQTESRTTCPSSVSAEKQNEPVCEELTDTRSTTTPAAPRLTPRSLVAWWAMSRSCR